jgi:nitrate/nitrite transporter NarK
MPTNQKTGPTGSVKLNQDAEGKATRVRLLDFSSAPMRAFHLSWFAFFVCFVAWFAIAPRMAIVRDDLKLTKARIGNTVIASVEITIDNVAALYFKDSFHLSLKLAGLLASATGMMNILARAVGGIVGDWEWLLPPPRSPLCCCAFAKPRPRKPRH